MTSLPRSAAWIGMAAIALAALPPSASPAAAHTPTPAPAPVPVVNAPPYPVAPLVTPPPPSPNSRQIPALTVIRIAIEAPIDSGINKIGETFPIRLVDPIMLDGGLEVPAGTTGDGFIVHAAKSRFGGKPGELILAARELRFEGVSIPLRSLSFIQGRGKDNEGTAAIVTATVGVIGMFITGGEVRIPIGTIAIAKTARPVIVTAHAPAIPLQFQPSK